MQRFKKIQIYLAHTYCSTKIIILQRCILTFLCCVACPSNFTSYTRSLASADFAVAVFTYAEIQRIAYIFFVIKSVQVRNQHKQNTYKCFWFHSREFSLCGFFPLKKPRNLRNSWCREKCLDDQNERCSESRIYHAFDIWLKSVFEIAFSLSWICIFTRNFVDSYFFMERKETFLWNGRIIKSNTIS